MQITVYSQARCQACEVLKSQLKLNGIPFEEKRIDLDAEAKAFVLGNGHRSVPVVYANGIHITNTDNLLVWKE